MKEKLIFLLYIHNFIKYMTTLQEKKTAQLINVFCLKERRFGHSAPILRIVENA